MSSPNPTCAERLTKGEKTRARLRKIAAAEFAQRGFHNTKVSDIVKASELTQPAFYKYFDSKEAAYEELVGEFRSRLEVLTSTLLISGQHDVLSSVEDAMLRVLDFLSEDPHLTEIGFFQPPASLMTKAGLASWIASNVKKEQSMGIFRPDIRAEQIGKCYVGMLDQIAREGLAPKERALAAHECALLIFEGIRVH
ncbi:TetR/AcrR family transcriptional regulator [Pseudomonas syringae]|uniref:TetR/AcrR family transcriptional regulator n=1 Tax=Pseudomonas syringae TaxID=317 RepID=UPI00215B1DCE|nr:TetR/AcrR family transcriptional regulator [Pseudomonas syringae]MCR8717702.1 TetR/AcrR family transcriptional regulator [Pseudomonas syringae]